MKKGVENARKKSLKIKVLLREADSNHGKKQSPRILLAVQLTEITTAYTANGQLTELF